jgi:prepilin peptidase CpaA
VAGFLVQSWLHGWRGLLSAAGGAGAGFAVFLVFYLLGGMGGGDIKLMSGFGALLGTSRVFEAALWAAACGGLLALAAIVIARIKAVGNRGATQINSIPYAPAIALGAWLALIPKG